MEGDALVALLVKLRPSELAAKYSSLTIRIFAMPIDPDIGPLKGSEELADAGCHQRGTRPSFSPVGSKRLDLNYDEEQRHHP